MAFYRNVPFAYRGSHFTKDFDLTVTYFAKNVSVSFVSEYMRISWRTVGRCMSRALKDLEPDIRRRYDNLVSIGSEKTSYKCRTAHYLNLNRQIT